MQHRSGAVAILAIAFLISVLMVGGALADPLMCPLGPATPQTVPATTSSFSVSLAGQTFGNLALFPCPGLMSEEQYSHSGTDKNGTTEAGFGHTTIAAGNVQFVKSTTVAITKGIDAQTMTAFAVTDPGRGSYNEHFLSSAFGGGDQPYDVTVVGAAGGDYQDNGAFVSKMTMGAGDTSGRLSYQAASGSPTIAANGDSFTEFHISQLAGNIEPVKTGTGNESITRDALTAFSRDTYTESSHWYGPHAWVFDTSFAWLHG